MNAKHLNDRKNALSLFALAVLIGLLVCSARLWVIKIYGVQEPYADSYAEIWDYRAVGSGDFRQVFENSLATHNEHRIFFTHWVNVGLFLLNHETWDLLGEASLNALLTGAIAFLVLSFLAEGYSASQKLGLALLLAFCFALPFAYENILWGFQSQHYFFTIFSLIAIHNLLSCRFLSVGWWLGLSSAVAACFSVGSGFYASLAVLGACGAAWVRQENRTRKSFLLAGICVVIVAANLPFIPRVESLDVYRAGSVAQFFNVFLRHLAWPSVSTYSEWLGIPMSLPFIWLVFGSVLRREPVPRSVYVLIGTGVWTFLISLSLSYMRGKYTPHPRYYDYNCFHLIVALCSLVAIRRLRLLPRMPGNVFIGLCAFWITAVLVGGAHLAELTFGWGLPHRTQELRRQQTAVQSFLRDCNPDVLRAPELNGVFPFSDAYYQSLASELKDPRVQHFLPNEMKPIELRQKSGGLTGRSRGWLLRHAEAGTVVSSVGVLLYSLLLGWMRFCKRQLKALAEPFGQVDGTG